jgi:hypothetical protein
MSETVFRLPLRYNCCKLQRLIWHVHLFQFGLKNTTEYTCLLRTFYKFRKSIFCKKLFTYFFYYNTSQFSKKLNKMYAFLITRPHTLTIFSAHLSELYNKIKTRGVVGHPVGTKFLSLYIMYIWRWLVFFICNLICFFIFCLLWYSLDLCASVLGFFFIFCNWSLSRHPSDLCALFFGTLTSSNFFLSRYSLHFCALVFFLIL